MKVVPEFTTRQMQTKNREVLINRLYAPIKSEVKAILDDMDTHLALSLDLIRDQKQYVKEWLSSFVKRGESINYERFIFYASLCYIYVALKMDKRQLAVLEQALLNIIENDPKISFEKMIGKLFPDMLLSKNIRGQVEKYAYFHYKDYERACELEKEVAKLKEQNDYLSLDLREKQSQIEKLKVLLEEKEELDRKNKSEIDRLNTELINSANRLEFEIHKYKEENRIFQIAYVEKLKRRISLEIEGMKTTLNYINEPYKEKLIRRITNIEDFLGNKGD